MSLICTFTYISPFFCILRSLIYAGWYLHVNFSHLHFFIYLSIFLYIMFINPCWLIFSCKINTWVFFSLSPRVEVLLKEVYNVPGQSVSKLRVHGSAIIYGVLLPGPASWPWNRCNVLGLIIISFSMSLFFTQWTERNEDITCSWSPKTENWTKENKFSLNTSSNFLTLKSM